jgi:hypothetical protein
VVYYCFGRAGITGSASARTLILIIIIIIITFLEWSNNGKKYAFHFKQQGKKITPAVRLVVLLQEK